MWFILPILPLDDEISALIALSNLTAGPTTGRNLPSITSPMADLGRLLFFSKHLGGEQDAACVSCHHPILGGGDNLSLSVGVHAVDVFNVTDAALLGIGRHAEVAGGLSRVPRNAPTTFNAGLWDHGLFWDSRVASISPEPLSNGMAGLIVTLITFDRIAEAIGEYERSMVFINSPWKRYVDGDLSALTNQQKEGAIQFLTAVEDGGAGCSRCHSGDTFSDGEHHIVGFPQVSDDRGREAIIGNTGDRYHFRTASLLNISVTAPYGHAGLYQTLDEVLEHYDNPGRTVDDLFGEQNNQPFADNNVPFCNLPQIVRIVEASGQACANLYPDAYVNSRLALQRLASNQARSPLGERANLNGGERDEIVVFLEALTDPCVESRDCLGSWIVDTGNVDGYPDDSALIAHDEEKTDL